MNRHLSILFVAAGLLLAGCHTVSITVIPDGADIQIGQQTMRAPASVIVHPFFPLKATVTAKGCAPLETAILYSSPSRLDFVLNRQFKADSQPSKAELSINGTHIGQTPVAFEIPANLATAALSFQKEGFLPKDITITTASSSQAVFAKLVPDHPGFLNWSVRPAKYGRVALVPDTVPPAEKTLNEPGNRQPVSIVQLSAEQLQILSFSLLPEQDSLLASVLVQTQATPPKHEARLTLIPLQPGKEYKYLTEGDIDITPSVGKSGVLFASNRTGRLDLWKCNLWANASTQKYDLVLSNELIMLTPQIQPLGDNVLLTVFQPDNLEQPQIWSFSNGNKNLIPEFFCNGENPSWAPNGRRIVFQKNSPSAIWRIESDGSLEKQLSPQNSLATFKQPVWSPDGKRIAFAANINAPQSPNDTDIWIMDADGGNLTQLTSSQALDDMPVWAEDGQSIYFRSNRDHHWGIWKIQVP